MQAVIEKEVGQLHESAKGFALKMFSPSEDDFAAVTAIVGKDASEFGIYQTVASSTRIDSDRDVFSKPLLDEMSKQYKEGRSVRVAS